MEGELFEWSFNSLGCSYYFWESFQGFEMYIRFKLTETLLGPVSRVWYPKSAFSKTRVGCDQTNCGLLSPSSLMLFRFTSYVEEKDNWMVCKKSDNTHSATHAQQIEYVRFNMQKKRRSELRTKHTLCAKWEELSFCLIIEIWVCMPLPIQHWYLSTSPCINS